MYGTIYFAVQDTIRRKDFVINLPRIAAADVGFGLFGDIEMVFVLVEIPYGIFYITADIVFEL